MNARLEDRTLRQALANAVARDPAHVFLRVVDGPEIRYGEISALAHRLAGGLQALGFGRGDRVMSMLPNGLEAIAIWLGCGVGGTVEVCLNHAHRGKPLIHAINASAARLLVLDAASLPALADIRDSLLHLTHLVVVGDFSELPQGLGEGLTVLPWQALADAAPLSEGPPLSGKDIAAILYTSGTTGPAKPVLLTHAQNYLTACGTRDCLSLTSGDISYCFHPMFHMAGKFMAAYGTLLAGATLVLDRKFIPEQWVARARRYGATVGYGHGPMLEMIHAVPPAADDADHIMTRVLAAPFPHRIARDFEKRFGVRGLECWGMTEIGIVTWPDLERAAPAGSCGRVDREHFDLRIVDPETDEEVPVGEAGEIVVRPNRPWVLFQGYLGMADAMVDAWRNGWFHTGDTGRLDADGNLFFIDRVKDKIRRRAENIASYDIESAANAHPAILEAAAVGIASEFEGDDDIKLTIVLRNGSHVEPGDLIAFLAGELPHFMVPRYIERREALPRSPTNKIQKADLRASGAGRDVWDRKAAGLSLKDIFERNSATCR